MEGSISIYLRFTGYDDKVLLSDGTHGDIISVIDNSFNTKNEQFIKVSAFTNDVEQVLNIGSQSSGSGAGKILFNPFSITKVIDATSPGLFHNAASGKAFKTVEVFFVNARKLLTTRHTYKLVALKTVAWSVISGETGMTETISFEYGGLVITVYPHNSAGSVMQAGWNRVKNVSDNDLGSVII